MTQQGNNTVDECETAGSFGIAFYFYFTLKGKKRERKKKIHAFKSSKHFTGSNNLHFQRLWFSKLPPYD